MRLDNRDLVLRGILGVLPSPLEQYLRQLLKDVPQLTARTLTTRDGALAANLTDLSTQIKILTSPGHDGRLLLPLAPGLSAKLREIRHFRNQAVHGHVFDADETLAALVAVSEALRLIEADTGREEIRELIAALHEDREVQGNPCDAVRVEITSVPVVSYAHAVAGPGPEITVHLSLPGQRRAAHHPAPAQGRVSLTSPASSEDPQSLGVVEVTISLIEEGSGKSVTTPVHLRWDTTESALHRTERLHLDRQALAQVEQSGPAHFQVELVTGEATTRRRLPGLVVLSPRDWQMAGDPTWAGRSLATFVQPTQTPVESIAREALRASHEEASVPAPVGTDALPGSRDAVVRAACQALGARGLRLEEAQGSWKGGAHPLRTAAEVLSSRAATPLDVAVLLAGVLERLQVSVTLLLTPRAVLLGYQRQGQDVPPTTTAEVIALVSDGTMDLIDPTLVVKASMAGLCEASKEVRDLARSALAELVLVVPLSQAREQGAGPQPFLTRDEESVTETPVPPLTPLTPGPGGPRRPREADRADGRQPSAGRPRPPAPGGTTPATLPPRVEEWMRSLLDLSVRNSLISRKESHAVRLQVPPELIAGFEDHVNGRNLIYLVPGRSAEGSEQDDARDAEELLAASRTVRVGLEGREYTRRLNALVADSTKYQEETGANSLHLALGTLTWTTDQHRLHSPLVLIPVTIEAGSDSFVIQLDQDGVSTPNFSLLARFQADTGIDLTELREPVRDEYGIDVEATVGRLRERLSREQVEARVEDSVHLGLFEFSTYLMWRDLMQDWETICRNPLVRRLLDGPGSPGTSASPQAEEQAACGEDIDEIIETLPLPADSKQARVVADAIAGHSLVVEGPPGTGKSQTVANLLFRAMACGKTVMFVAEKASALDVVARRLRKDGIGDLVLDLHDNGQKPARVREALRRALEVPAPPADALTRPGPLRDHLAELRTLLERYRDLVHAPGADGQSLYEARQALVAATQDPAGDPEAEQAFAARYAHSGVNTFDPARHNALIQDYHDTLERLRSALTPELVATVLSHRQSVLRQAGDRADRLRAELSRRKGTLSVRELIATYEDLVTAITPCILASPDSVARFFPVKSAGVDIIVLDEASQITVAAAVGAIGRSRSAVVVGDPKQMPPASPSRAAAVTVAPSESQNRDNKSILDWCLDVGLTRRRLTWHYRSQVESLIAFSNKHYYDGALFSLPSPLTLADQPDDGPEGYGLSLRTVSGTYVGDRKDERARHQKFTPNTNRVEARQIVEEVLRRFEASPERVPSLGVITLNARQAELIEGWLRKDGSERVVAALEERDGLLVRNLDNVQGEERDTILMSLTFSANKNGEVRLNFGSLSHAGGERRLNVAITRARRQMVVFASFKPEDLHAERSTHQGLKDLRAYLELAQHGRAPRAVPASRSQVDPHRAQVAEALRAAGLEVRVGVGHSAFEIDLVVSSKGQDSLPRVAVLLDGPGWARRCGVSDRDLLPVGVLKTMGWEHVERVWLPQWLSDPQAVVTRLVETVTGRPAPVVAGHSGATTSAPGAADSAAEAVSTPAHDQQSPESGPAVGHSGVPLGPELLVGPSEYSQWHPAGTRPTSILDQAEKDEEARKQVLAIAKDICAVESPLSRHRLIVKICRAFSLSTTRRSREERVSKILGDSFAYTDDLGFVWRSLDAYHLPVSYRRNALDYLDSIEEIHPRELVALMGEVRRTEREWASPEDLYTKALRRLSTRKRKLHARGVLEALRKALAEVERAEETER